VTHCEDTDDALPALDGGHDPESPDPILPESLQFADERFTELGAGALRAEGGSHGALHVGCQESDDLRNVGRKVEAEWTSSGHAGEEVRSARGTRPRMTTPYRRPAISGDDDLLLPLLDGEHQLGETGLDLRKRQRLSSCSVDQNSGPLS